MTEEQQALCLDNMRLVSHRVKKFLSWGIPWEELRACGDLGLAQAAVNFSPEKNASFSTYACKCIDNDRLRRGSIASLCPTPGSARQMRSNCCPQGLPDDTDMAETVEQSLRVSEAMAVLQALPERRRMIWELRLGLTGEPPMTQKEIARRIGRSRTRVGNIIREGFKTKTGE